MKKILLITTALLIAGFIHANTIVVDNINDSGVGSLRQASIDAASGDTIRFNPSLLTAAIDSISLVNEIDFGAKAIVIKGLYTATDTLFVSGANSSRIFSFHGAGKVVLDSLVLINGSSIGAGGGAVFFNNCSDTLHILNSTLKNNTTPYGSSGGAIQFYSNTSSSTLVVNNSIISNNIGAEGGAIRGYMNFPNSYLVVTNSTISNNSSRVYAGGGIHCNGSSGYLTVTNSTISNNNAGSRGGGIFGGLNITVINSTINNNNADRGAGICGESDGALDITVTNSTISNNNAGNSGGGIYGNSYGGIMGPGNESTSITIINSTLANNLASTSADGIFSYSDGPNTLTIGSSIFDGNIINSQGLNSITSLGYNVFSDSPTGATATGDQVNQSLNLLPLAFNGGATQTMLPGIGSVAIDMGNPLDMSVAQNRTISGGRRDVGAAETDCIATAGTHNETVCFGDSITVNGTVYNANNLTGTEVFTNVGENNCDSTVTVTLTVENAIDVTTTTVGLTLTANATGATYQWVDCSNANSEIVGATNATYTATVNGDYAVVVTVGNCSDTSACVNISTVGIEKQANNINLDIYPNPTTNKLTIENEALTINNISILNITGGVVKTITKSTKTIDVSNLTKGIYFLQIHTDKGIVNKKFIKE